ncbi:hypothetical protein BKA93DRAFT_730440 [Sparassis latifolia]
MSDSRHSAASTVLLPVATAAKGGPGIPDNAANEESTTRQWSFAAFEWVVRDVHRLRDFVEGPETTDASDTTPENQTESEGGPEADDFEILRESPMLGDGKFKLEIGMLTTGPQTLSVYITSLMVDFAHADYEMCTSMFAAIKCQDDRIGERGARAQWVWEYWQNGWVFRQESEVWACPLPSLSSLLENPRIRETDSFVICVQIHSPIGPFFPQQPSAYYVPRDLLDGLEASLDNPNTGDVQFICLERRDAHQELSDSTSLSPITATPMASPSSSSSQSFTPQTVARKRIIYAHADILTRRSEYFTTMFSSSFAEVPGIHYPGGRKIYTVTVEEADFVTIYWLLKWVYANWLLFRKEDDPREAVNGMGAGWSARGFGIRGAADEWEWKAFSKNISTEGHTPGGVSDARSVTSAESAVSGSATSKDKGKYVPDQSQAVAATTTRIASTSKAVPPPPSPSRPSTTNARRPSVPASTNTSGLTVPNVPGSAASRGTKPVPVPISPSKANYTAPPRYPLSPHQQRQRSHPSAPSTDPHPHPTAPPPPASALSMYQIAHRYAMPGLASLALEHILSTITPQAGFPVLLATSAWEELHSLVEDYVVEKWDEVSVSDEFERCCQEVAAGEWGPEGGTTLMALFRRLRSPNAMAYARS